MLLALSLAAAPARAADAEDADRKNDAGWVVTIGANVEYGPTFPGSTHHSIGGMPTFDIRRFSEPDENSAPDDNIDYTLIGAGNFEAGPVLGFRDRRSISDDERVGGLHKIEWSPDIGIFAQQWIVPDQFRVRAEIRQAIRNDTGLVADLGADWFIPLSDKLTVSVGPRASVGSSRYMKQYFGVSADDAAANSNVSAYDAPTGVQSTGVIVSASYQVTPTVTMGVYNRFDRLVGSAADSPITQRFGSENQNTVGISLTKAFSVNF